MKKTSQRLLACMYSRNEPTPSLNSKQLPLVLPDLSDSGRRSLIHWLEKSGLISSERLPFGRQLVITNLGRRSVEAIFPALLPKWDSWQGQWSLLLFLKPPVGDKGFRFLRTQVLLDNAFALSRGTYIKPGEFSSQFKALCERLYARSVMLMRVNEIEVGSIRPIAVKEYSLDELSILYSGLSKDIDALLSNVGEQKRLSTKQKQQIYHQIERFVTVLSEDPGITKYYFPESARPQTLLEKLQKLLML